jgi:tetratricopeptide (TPR) repeat protein
MLLLIVAATLVGCAGASPNPFASNQVTHSDLSTSQYANAGNSQSVGQTAVPNASATSTPYSPSQWSEGMAAASASAAGGALATVQGGFKKVTNALQPRARVVPPLDPISLGNSPGEVGADLYYHAAQVYESQGKVKAAVDHYEKALSVDESDFRSLISLARLYDRQGDLAHAESYYQRVIHAHPNRPTCFNDLGLCYARRGNLRAAEATLQRAVELDPQNARYRNNLANVLVQDNRLEEAFLQLAATHGPAAAHYNLAYMLVKRNRRQDAELQLQMALQKDPSLVAAQRLLAQISGARAARRVGQTGSQPLVRSATRPVDVPRALPPI